MLRATVSARRGHSANGKDRSPRRLAALTRDCYGGRRCATVASADPNDADFAHLEELNPGNSRRHMGVRETTAAGVRVPGTMGTDADELLALT